MRPDNPACYECKSSKHKGKIHRWRIKLDAGTAKCDWCELELTPEQTVDLMTTPKD